MIYKGRTPDREVLSRAMEKGLGKEEGQKGIMHNEKSIFKIVINLWMGVIRCVQPQIAFRVRNIKFDKYA